MATKPPPVTSKHSRLRPVRAMPSAIRGRQTSSRYRRVQKPCRRTPSATSPASRSECGPTAAMVIGVIGCPVEAGVKLGVMRVKV